MKHCAICESDVASGLVVHEDCAALARAVLDINSPDTIAELLRLRGENAQLRAERDAAKGSYSTPNSYKPKEIYYR